MSAAPDELSGGYARTTESHNRTFRTLDGLRGLAALLIVLRHTENFFAPISFQESYLAVDLFFVMSGVVLCHSYERKLLRTLSPWRFAWLRIVRIYPLYLLGCAIAVPALLLARDSVFQAQDFAKALLVGLFLLPNLFGGDLYPLNAPSWSLFFELFVNFVYGFLIRTLNSRHLSVIVIASGLALIPVIVFSKHHNMNLGFTFKSFPTGFIRVSYSFFIGVLACRAFNKRPSVVSGFAGNAFSWAVAAVVVALLVMPVGVVWQGTYDFVVVAMCFPVIVYLSLRLVMTGPSAWVFKNLGVTSYAIYVLHAPTARLMESRLPQHGLEVVPYAPWFGIGFLVVLTLGSYIIDRAYDMPIRRFLTASRTA